MATATDLLALHAVPSETPIAELNATVAFTNLTSEEAQYALALADAAWEGQKITVLQISPEAPPLFALVRLLADDVDALKTTALGAGVSDSDLTLLLAFLATFIDNASNYKSFGDTKLVPGCPASVFATVLRAVPAYKVHAELMEKLWAAVAGPLYDLSPRLLQLGMGPEDGISTYYSANMSKADTEVVGRWTTAHKLPQPYNTRVFKFAPGPTGVTRYQIRLASSDVSSADGAAVLLGVHAWEGAEIEVVRGDYAPILARVNTHLQAAMHHAANEREKAMLASYVTHFTTGDMRAHVEGSTTWVSNKGPVVETYMGFIESYRDPMGTRGEWEGFVAVVNKETSAKFGELVSNAPRYLELLPWGASFEKDKFMAPDFSSLEVLAFAGSGVPAGINIPNYDDVRQVHGFKNVSLGNVLSARDLKERCTFLCDADQALYKTKLSPSFEVQVGLHELLGHGSGKLFTEEGAGGVNFDRAAVTNPLTGGAITSWYKEGETWDSMFGSLASTIEECRAEAVGIYLCTDASVLRVFGHAADGEDIVYINWLNMARAGLLALQYYNPKTRAWGQAHMQARYALLRVMLEAGQGFVTIPGLTADVLQEGDDGVHVRLDRASIRSVGMPAVGAFLRKLQVYKSTADVATLTSMYLGYTSVPDDWLRLRDLVVAKRRPRQMFVQPLLERGGAPRSSHGTVVRGLAQSDVVLRTFEPTPEGMLHAFAARYAAVDDAFLALWEAERPMHALL